MAFHHLLRMPKAYKGKVIRVAKNKDFFCSFIMYFFPSRWFVKHVILVIMKNEYFAKIKNIYIYIYFQCIFTLYRTHLRKWLWLFVLHTWWPVIHGHVCFRYLVKRDLSSVGYCKVAYTSATFYKVPEQHDHVYLVGLYTCTLTVFIHVRAAKKSYFFY